MGSLGFWQDRLTGLGIAVEGPAERFGERLISLKDHDGLMLEQVEDEAAARLPGWAAEGVPAEHAIRSFRGITLWVEDTTGTAKVLTEVLGYAADSERLYVLLRSQLTFKVGEQRQLTEVRYQLVTFWLADGELIACNLWFEEDVPERLPKGRPVAEGGPIDLIEGGAAFAGHKVKFNGKAKREDDLFPERFETAGESAA